MLSERQIDQYHRDGYVIPDYRVPDDTLEAIEEDHDRFLRRFPEFRDYCPSLLIYDTAFLNYARNPDLVEIVTQLIGQNVALWNSSFFAKPALNGTKTRRILAHSSACDLYGVDCRGRFNDRERMLESDTWFPSYQSAFQARSEPRSRSGLAHGASEV